jgi:hypothetical protein
MILHIPANFPVEYFKDSWLKYKKDNQKNRLDTLYIILNEFCRNGVTGGWINGVPLNNTALRAVCSKNFDDVIKDLLLLDNSSKSIFHTDGKYDPNFSSKCYKLGMKFCYSGTIEVELTSNERLKKYLDYLAGKRVYKKEIKNIEPKIHLEKQFKELTITIENDVYRYKNLYIERIRDLIKVEKNKKIKFLYYAEIGKILDDIDLLEKNNFQRYTLSDKNLRFYSLFTNINKELRWFLRHNGNKFVELDIVASHSYVLATILTNDFFSSKENEYSIYNIYNDLVLRIESYIDSKNKYNNNNNYTEAQEAAARRMYHHMSDRFFENEDIILYRSIDFEADFYQFIADVHHKVNPVKNQLSRNKIKSMVRLWMNHTDPHERKHVKSLELFKYIFPNINLLINEIGFFRTIKSAFSHLLQRSESHLVLDVTAKKLIAEYPSNKIFTIHDSFLFEDNGVDIKIVIEKIKQDLKDYTGIIPGIKLKNSNPFDSIDEIIEEDIMDVKKKASEKEKIIIDENDRVFNTQRIRLVNLGIQEVMIKYGDEDESEKFKDFINQLYSDRKNIQ